MATIMTLDEIKNLVIPVILIEFVHDNALL